MPQYPYGTWPSPISAADVAAQGTRLGAVSVSGGNIYWIEGRPHEGGRNVLVCRRRDGATRDVVPAGFNLRSRVHEYGGGAYVIGASGVYFSNFSDQRIYRSDGVASPVAMTPEGPWFYADFALDPMRPRLVCVREDHSGAGEPLNTLISISLDAAGEADVIVEGHDFYATPRFNRDGSRLCWLAWRHPNMPWDGTELWVADLTADGAVADPACIAGGDDESIYQPGWAPDGTLYFVSDRDGWWKLYRWRSANRPEIAEVLKNPPSDAEFGRPQWVLGTATWVFVDTTRILAAYTRRGRWYLADIDAASGVWRTIRTDFEPHDWVAADARSRPGQAVIVAASPARADCVVRVDVATDHAEVVHESSPLELASGTVSEPQPIQFQTEHGETAHAFYYPPASATCSAPPGSQPPLIAISHGGPTTATNATLDLRIQYWTSRGFAVVDVNYRGSSGYGRAYRNRLRGHWGIADVVDMVCAARHLTQAGLADVSQLVIRGGSAGGYTTLAALTFHAGVFTAGASYYGISDIEALARDTHKFEARYLDRLVGPYPEHRDVYYARSPIHFVDRLACPIILLQGLEDKVVPPNQSQMMADAARAKGLPVAYLTFAGEQHGFRKAETIVQSLEAELYFYGRVFGFHPADPLPAIHIDNL